MVTLLTIIHVLVALVLILVVLLQSARGTDLAGAFGGAGSQTAFGPRGTSNFLSRTTAVLAAVFMVTALTLSLLSNRGRKSASVLSGEKAVPASQQKAPPAPGPQSPAQPTGITPVAPLTPGTQPTVQVIPAAPAAPLSKAPAQPPAPSTPAPANPSGGAAPAPPSGQ